MQRLTVGVLALGFLIVGCDDDDDDEDREDAGVIDAGVIPDTGVADAGMIDTGVTVDAGGDAGPMAATFTVPLTTAEEVPVCTGAGAGAGGSANVMVDAANTMIVVTDLSFESLSGPATAAHIHSGAPGVAGPIVLDFGEDPTSPIDQTFTAADYPSPPPEGAPADFEGFVEAMRMGQTYINVHTAECPMGEVRGQID